MPMPSPFSHKVRKATTFKQLKNILPQPTKKNSTFVFLREEKRGFTCAHIQQKAEGVHKNSFIHDRKSRQLSANDHQKLKKKGKISWPTDLVPSFLTQEKTTNEKVGSLIFSNNKTIHLFTSKIVSCSFCGSSRYGFIFVSRLVLHQFITSSRKKRVKGWAHIMQHRLIIARATGDV